MDPPANPDIFHITHVENLPGIIAAGGLCSDARCRTNTLTKVDVGYSDIKGRRMRRPVPAAARGFLGEYVPFNFCPRSVMLYVLKRGHETYAGGQSAMVHLVSDVGTAIGTGLSWTFTDRHAVLGYAKYHEDLARLCEVKWQDMPVTVWWGGDSEIKERRQAEFLVHDHYPWSAIKRICVIDGRAKDRVLRALSGAAYRPPVTVRPDWYYEG